MLVADLKILFGYSHDEIMHKIPFNSLLMQYHSYNQRALKQIEPKEEEKEKSINSFAGL